MASSKNNVKRFEYKYPVDQTLFDRLFTILNLNCTRVHYGDHDHSRIKSVYFDDIFYGSYFENIDGLYNKTKFRLRWYDDDFNNKLFFEKKYRHGAYTLKDCTKIDAFDTDPYSKIIQNIQNTISDQQLYDFSRKTTPIALISYKRFYFERDNVRITLDTDIQFLSQRNILKPSNRKNQSMIQSDLNVMEIKALGQTPHLSKIFDPLWLRVDKCSKYIHACNAIAEEIGLVSDD